MENMFNSQKKGKYYHCRQKITFYFSDVYKAQKLDNTIQIGRITGLIIHSTHYLFSDWPKAYSEFFSGRLYNKVCFVDRAGARHRKSS